MNSFGFALKVFLFLAPIVYWQNLPLAQIQIQFFQLGTIFLFLFALSQKKQRDLRDNSLFGLGLVCFLSIFIAKTPLSNMAMTNILFALLFYYLIVCYTKDIRCIFKVLVALSIVNTLLALFQRFGIDFVFDESSECCAFLATSAFHGDFQALVLPLAFYLHPLLAVFPIVGLVLSKSATGLAAASAGLGFLLIRKRLGPIYFLALFSGLAAFIIHFRELLLYKIIMRFTIWGETLKLIFDRPYRGWGFGSIRGFTEILYWKKYGNADRIYNDYLEFALCVGVIGFIFFVLFIRNKIKRYRKVQSKTSLLNTVFASCIIASVICLFHSPMAPLFSGIGKSPRIAIVIITMLAMLEILLQKEGGVDG